MDVTFRESKPFYGEPTDLSLSFAELDHLHFVKDGQKVEQVVSQGYFVGTKSDDDVQVQFQLIVGTNPVGTLANDDVQVQVWPTMGTI